MEGFSGIVDTSHETTSFFPLGYPHLGVGPAEDGDARSVGRQPGGDGAAPRQGNKTGLISTNEIKLVNDTLIVSFMKGRLERDGGDGLVRAAGGGDGDEGQRAGAGLRVHDGVHRGGQKGD